ncbi:MAG: gamma-glutamylcyclotransferase [Gloeobacteraceae cyanobacterium ES-bin-144]|nr:gamma-glutamylcyclotransferase [Verrucomicrobiales bacterium]
MTAARELVFVYGTLRRDASNHFRMAGAEFISAGSIRGRMYGFGWYPGLVLDDAGDDLVGEIYAVNAALLAELDRFEGLSAGEIESEYRRVRVDVLTDTGVISAWVWEWLGLVDESQRITGGDWLEVPDV